MGPIQGFRMPAAHERFRTHRRPAYENLQRRKPREGIRGSSRALYGDLSVACDLKIECIPTAAGSLREHNFNVLA